MKTGAWGMDYRKTMKAKAERDFEKWIIVVMRLNDGKILSSWTCDHRPELYETRQVLGHALTKYGHPELIWCDAYLTDLVIPEVTKYGIRVHVRMVTRPTAPLPVAADVIARMADAAQPEKRSGLMTWLNKFRGILWTPKTPVAAKLD